MTDDTVLDRRDATDLETNDEVEQTVDEMLDTDDLDTDDLSSDAADADAAESAGAGTAPEPDAASGADAASAADGGSDADDIDPTSFDFENQEWTLGGRKESEVHEIQGMKFLFEEPDNDDAVLNELDQVAEDDRSAQMKALVQLVVAEPTITDDRWEQMSFAGKLGLAGQAAEFLGLSEGFLNE